MNPHPPPELSRQARPSAAPRHVDLERGKQVSAAEGAPARERAIDWSFLTKHAHVLVCLEEDPQIRIRTLAARIGLSPRATLRILDDLEGAQYITRRRARRGSRYEVHRQHSRRCPVIGDLPIRELLRLICGDSP